MALRLAYDTEQGVNCPEAHCVITRVKCLKKYSPGLNDGDDDIATFKIRYNGQIYYNEQAYLDKKSPVAGLNIEYDLNISDDANHYNIMKECYEHLKTVNGFENGVDC